MNTNVTEFVTGIGNWRKQIPFALSLGVNRTTAEIQRVQVEHMNRVFNVRQKNFIGSPQSPNRSAIKRVQKATKASPVAVLQVLPPGGIERADILTRHESDRERQPHAGSRTGLLAVPVEARRGKSGKIPAKFRPKALGFQPHGSSGRVWVGAERTFLVIFEDDAGAIFQRTSRRRKSRRKRGKGYRAPGGENPFHGTRLLYWMSGSTPLDQRLEFAHNAGITFDRWIQRHMLRAMAEALQTKGDLGGIGADLGVRW